MLRRKCKGLTIFLLVLLLTSWLTPTLFAKPSQQESSGSPICFSESEWTAFQAKVQQATQETAEEAVKTAVIPLKGEIAGLQSQLAGESRLRSRITRERDLFGLIALIAASAFALLAIAR